MALWISDYWQIDMFERYTWRSKAADRDKLEIHYPVKIIEDSIILGANIAQILPSYLNENEKESVKTILESTNGSKGTNSSRGNSISSTKESSSQSIKYQTKNVFGPSNDRRYSSYSEKEKLPKTGETVDYRFVCLGFVLLVGSIGMMNKKKVHSKE